MDYALITGASSGIGSELAVLFAKNGHNLFLVARQENRLVQLEVDLEKKYKISTIIFPADLNQTDSIQEIFRLVQESVLLHCTPVELIQPFRILRKGGNLFSFH